MENTQETLHKFEVKYQVSKNIFGSHCDEGGFCEVITSNPNNIKSEIEKCYPGKHVGIIKIEDMGICDEDGELLFDEKGNEQ